MALGPSGSVVRVRTRSRAGTLNVLSITRLSSLANSQSTPSTTAVVPNSVSSAAAMPSAEQMNNPIPASLTGKNSSGRTYPAKATMQVLRAKPKSLHFYILPLMRCSQPDDHSLCSQWDYIATREDELTAMAGESILVAGEYKNPGWVWAARMLAGGQPSTYRLVPANYITYTDSNLNKSGSGMDSSMDKRASPLLTSTSGAPSNNMPSSSSMGSSRASPLLPPASAMQAPAAAAPFQPAASSSVAMPVVPAGETPMQHQVSLFSDADSSKSTGPSGMSSKNDSADDDGLFQGSGMQLVGDANDPYLDGMYEDESGLISVNC
jgi:hypothetical protein